MFVGIPISQAALSTAIVVGFVVGKPKKVPGDNVGDMVYWGKVYKRPETMPRRVQG